MPSLYRGKIPIITRDLNEGFLRGVPGPVSFGCVPRDYDIDPLEMRDNPATMPMVPESDWDARFDEDDANETSLEHLYLRGDKPAFSFLDQNGFPDCHTADTEVLTEKGFVAWPDYNWTDLLATVNPVTHAMEFQAPFDRTVKEYDGPMVHSTNRRLNFAVTPNHGMYVRKWDEKLRTLSSNYSFVKAAEIGWYAGMLPAPSGCVGTELVELEIPGDRRYDGDDLVAMLALVVSDGYAGGSEGTRPGKGTRNLVSFCSFREDIRPAVESLASRLGFTEVPSRRGVWNRWGAPALAEWIRTNAYVSCELGSKNKRVPDLVKVASERQIKLFLHWFGDRNRKGNLFYSSSKRLIDDLQELHLRVGKRTTITERTSVGHEWEGKTFVDSHGYVLVVGVEDRLCIDRKKHIEIERYKGQVYCAAVPNHTLVTRRKGTVLISSNCWTHSTAHTIMLMAMAQGQPVVRLNAVAVATMLNQTNGGWCGLSMKFARENGYPEIGTGPGQWPYQSRHGKDTPELRANMKKHLNLEDWYDLGKKEYNQTLTKQQLQTCSFNNHPMATDFNRFGHSMACVRIVRYEKGAWAPLIMNSWVGFGYYGLAVLADIWPDNAVALRSTTPSVS